MVESNNDLVAFTCSSDSSVSALSCCSSTFSQSVQRKNEWQLKRLFQVVWLFETLSTAVLVVAIVFAESISYSIRKLFCVAKLLVLATAYLVFGAMAFVLDIVQAVLRSTIYCSFRDEYQTRQMADTISCCAEAAAVPSSSTASPKPYRRVMPEFPQESQVACFDGRRCVYADGSLAPVPAGHSPAIVPPRYLAAHRNHQGAARAWGKTQRWRLEENVWKILEQPRSDSTKLYCHCLHGHSMDGYSVLYEQLKPISPIQDDGSQQGVLQDVVRDYVYILEFLSNKAPPPRHSGVVYVIDLKAMSSTHLKGRWRADKVRLLEILNAHYPGFLRRVIVVNAPFWLSMMGSTSIRRNPHMVNPLLGCPVHFCSEESFLEELRTYVSDDQIPTEFGGSSPVPLSEHPYQHEMGEASERSDNTRKEIVVSDASRRQSSCEKGNGPSLQVPILRRHFKKKRRILPGRRNRRITFR